MFLSLSHMDSRALSYHSPLFCWGSGTHFVSREYLLHHGCGAMVLGIGVKPKLSNMQGKNSTIELYPFFLIVVRHT